jgi:hypothetical protein
MKPVLLSLIFLSLGLTGCTTLGSSAADLGLAGAGSAAGYQVSDGKMGGAAVGAAAGYVGSRLAQTETRQAIAEAEQRGFDRARNQVVKQQYWIIQNQQRSREAPSEAEAKLIPVVIPETTINGVRQNAHVEYLRASP